MTRCRNCGGNTIPEWDDKDVCDECMYCGWEVTHCDDFGPNDDEPEDEE